MVTIHLPGVNQVRKRQRDGTIKIHYYHRATKTKLPDDPATPEFVARVLELNGQMARPDAGGPKPGTIAALVEHFKGSAEFTALAEKTRKDYGRYLDVIRETWGPNRVAGIDREAVLDLRDAYQETPRTANYVVSVLRLLLTFAVDRPAKYGLTHNPAARPKKLKTGEGHRPWEEGEIAAFRAYWSLGSVERTAFELGLNTGQRGEDIIAMERAHIGADGSIAVAQEKTKARVWVPQSVDLRAALAAWDVSQAERRVSIEDHGGPAPLATRRMLLTTERGKAFKVDHFRHVMIAAYQAVPGLPAGMESGGVTTHGLRYTAATILHELGNDWDTIAAITGHETVQMVRKYTAKKRRAKVAIASLDEARRATKGGPEGNPP
ncbi:MAG: tyrosine-type recombinase/integrase [Alphaproteobacteria bacterium]|nr:tyrosine-type recombinase/integrase [Alphaproteobacteria bacterium]